MKAKELVVSAAVAMCAVQVFAVARPFVVGAEQAQTRIVMLDPDVVAPAPAKNGQSRVYTLPVCGFYKAHFFTGKLGPSSGK